MIAFGFSCLASKGGAGLAVVATGFFMTVEEGTATTRGCFFFAVPWSDSLPESRSEESEEESESASDESELEAEAEAEVEVIGGFTFTLWPAFDDVLLRVCSFEVSSGWACKGDSEAFEGS